MNGVPQEFPLKLNCKENIIVNSVDELAELIYDEFQRRLKNRKESKLMDVFWWYGLKENTVAVTDSRTIDIIRKYEFLKYSPHLINNGIWIDCVSILNRSQPRLF